MKKFTTTTSPAPKARDASVTERTYPKAQRVDPSVCLGPLGEMTRGAVDMSVTIGKPQAYIAKKGTP